LAGYSAPQNAVDEAIPFAITPDASMAAYGSPTIHLLDLATGQERWHADAAKDYVMALAFSPDGKILASSAGYHESSIRFWDVTSGKEIARLQAHGDWVGTMAFWPDGKALASSSEDGTIRVWNLSQFTNIPPPRVAGVNMEMGHVILLPDNTRLVSGDIDGSIRVWDTARQDTAGSPVTLPVRLGGAWRVAPDSQSLLTVAGGQVARWTGKDFQQMEALMVVGNSGDCRDYLFSKDSQLLAVTSKDGNVRVWDLPQREIKYQFKCPGAPSPVAFRSGGRELVVADRDGGALHEWNLTTGKETRYWRKPKAGSHWYGGFAFSPDDRWHLSVDSAGTVLLHDLIANRTTNADLLMGHIDHVAFSPDSRLFATLSDNLGFNLNLWETDNLRPLGRMETGGHSLSFSPDGERLAIGSGGKDAVSIWDVAGARQLLSLEGESRLVWWCEFSPDGNVIGALNGLGVLRLWRAPSWAEIEAAEKAGTW
jgi:WD40 repeat protein